MTSEINFGAIDATFPIAGQDNDSNGFRENFSAIQSALAAAKTEIEDLQGKSILVATLGDGTPEPVANDLSGSSISNGIYSQLNGAVPGNGLITVTDGTGDIDLNAGPFQVFKIIGGDATLRFVNWTADPIQYSVVRVHLISDGSARVVTFASENAGVIVGRESVTLSNDITVHTVIEAWCYNGNTVFLQTLAVVGDLGEEFNSINVIGTTTTGTLISTNTTDTSSSVTGAIRVAGGVGIAKKLFVGGNVQLGTNGSNTVVIKGNLVVEGNVSLATSSITIANINDIGNVDTISTSLLTNQILKYNGSNWVNTNNNLNDITDVNISLPSAGDTLQYNPNTQTWDNNLDLVEYTVTVQDNGSGVQEVFFLNGQALVNSVGTQRGLEFRQGTKYRFKLDDPSNGAAPLRFSTTADTAVPASITPYTTGVTISGTAGTAGAYVEIRITVETPKILFLYAFEANPAVDTSLIGAAYPISVGSWYYTGSEELTDEDVVSPAKSVSYFNTGATAIESTLPVGKDGQVKSFMLNSGTETMTITVSNPGWGGAGTITFDGVGTGCTVQYVNNKWFCIGNNGAVFA